MSQKEKSQLWKRKLTGLHSLPMPHHFLSTFLKMWGNLEQRSPSLLFPNLIPLLAERNKKKIQKRSWRRKEKREKIVETIRAELVFVRGVTQEAKRAASLLFPPSPPFLAHPDPWQSLSGQLLAEPQVVVPSYLLSQDFGPCQPGGSWIDMVIARWRSAAHLDVANLARDSVYLWERLGKGWIYPSNRIVGKQAVQYPDQGH